MKAHTDELPESKFIEIQPTVENLIGNALADAAAGAGRDKFSSVEVWSRGEAIGAAHGRAFNIVKRLAIVQARAWQARDDAKIYDPIDDNLEEPMTVEEQLGQLKAKMLSQQHRLERRGNKHHCIKCGRCKAVRKLRDWTSLPCNPRLTAWQEVGRHQQLRGEPGWDGWKVTKRKRNDKDETFKEEADEAVTEETQDEGRKRQRTQSENRSDVMERVGGAIGADAKQGSHRPPCDFDDEDGSIVEEDPAEEAVDGLMLGWDDIPVDETTLDEAAYTATTVPKRVRLTSKTPAEQTPYGKGNVDDGRLTRRQAMAARKRLAVKKLRLKRANQQTARVATRVAARNPDLVNACPWTDRNAEDPFSAEETRACNTLEYHKSHSLTKSPGQEIVYCKFCGCWCAGGKPRGLAIPCKAGMEGRKCSRQHVLRLLQLGIFPSEGARTPQALKRGGARGTRNQS